MPNKILKLIDKPFVLEFFRNHIMPNIDGQPGLIDLKIKPHKNNVWRNSYHVVTEYCLRISDAEKKEKELSIFCTAHDNEPREKVFNNLKFLQQNDFGDNAASLPEPLYYSPEFNATFYIGLSGQNLYHYIKLDNRTIIERTVIKAAGWFAGLHALPTNTFFKVDTSGDLIKNVVPGVDYILYKTEIAYPRLFPAYQKIYAALIETEEKNISTLPRLSIVHGDAHPENIIIINRDKIGIIDFTDLCLTDFARDLGCFMQQLNYMMMKKIGDQAYADEIKSIFLENYLKNAKIEMTDGLKNRISLYYNWTQMRTATYLLMSHNSQPDKAEPLINEVIKNLNL